MRHKDRSMAKLSSSGKSRLMMVFKLLDMAQQRWRRINAPNLLPLVRAGVKFSDGLQAEHVNQVERKDAA